MRRNTRAVKKRLAALRAQVRSDATDRPGVYRMVAADGEVVYVGKSKRLRRRLLSYFRGDYPQDKSARIVREVAAIEWQYVPSEFAALLEELRLIKRLRPRFNVALKRDARHYAFIAMAGGKAPRLTVLRGGGTRTNGPVYGPFVGAARLREALRELSDELGLRDCSLDRRMRFADQGEIFAFPPRTPGCIRHEIGKCLGPCVGAATAGVYLDRVQQARAFLDGTDDSPVERLRAAMLEASGRLQYERAASLRDKVSRLDDLRDQFARLRFAVESLTFSYHVPGQNGEDRVYLIRRGVVRAELAEPRSAEDEAMLRDRVLRVLGGSRVAARASLPAHEIDELLLVASWFRLHPDEMERTRRWSA